MQQLALGTGWELKERDPRRSLDEDFAAQHGWIPAEAPGTVHQALLAAERIPDPFVGLHDDDVQWVGERDWLYRCSFDLGPDLLDPREISLCFDGLDTFATVWLNGEHVLTGDNMFVPHRIPVKPTLRAGHNELWILFESALRRGREREATYGKMAVWNGDASRVYARKAQYHYGRDWGPCLLTAGPWLPVRLEAYDARIGEISCGTNVAADLRSAQLLVQVELDGCAEPQAADATLELRLHGPSGDIVHETRAPVTQSEVEHRFELAAPELWWPRGYGAQARYRLQAVLLRDGTEIDRRELRLGLRRLRLVQEPLEAEPGTTFLFEINNVPIFCGGANWIPADSFTPAISADRYRAWLTLAAEANMVMLRVWGGGIYEPDIFYDLCDELGLLVWQDFMFACGMYPAQEWFQTSVRAEAEAQVRRLRHHPCIALWCGNNEDYQIAESINAYDAAFTGDFAETAVPARAIYERLLPDVCSTLDPQRPYWPGSAFGGASANDPTVGDRHTWDVWHGQMADYHRYPELGGRFVSEFGMQAAPARRTLDSCLPAEERYPQSRTLEHHNKAEGGPRRLAVYLSDTLRVPADLDGYIYATQFVQAEALGAAYRGWRRRWGGPGRYAVGGALVWQLDDCWPVVSWAIVDYALRPKAAYYVVRRELHPISLGLQSSGAGVDVWAINSRLTAQAVELDVRQWTLAGECVAEERRSVLLPANRATDLGTVRVPDAVDGVVAARLSVGGAVVSRATLWPEPFKYLDLPDPEITCTLLPDNHVRLSARRPAKGAWLDGGDQVRWSDNMLDLLPGDDQTVVADGLGASEIRVRWLQ